jgi:signal transduction histidine kinase
MNLNKRLVISNALVVIIPIVVTIMATFIIYFISSITYNNKVNYNNFKELLLIRTELFGVSNSIPKQEPENIEKPEFQRYLLQRLSNINGEIIIVKNRNLIFSSKEISKIDLEKCFEITKSQNIHATGVNKALKLGGISYIIESSTLKFQDGSTGEIMLLAPIGKELFVIESLLIVILIVFILSFAGTNAYVSYRFSRRILRPVSNLKKAAAEITNGNLNYEIIEDGDAEIKELCRDFETMRIQLKDSIKMKMKYDDNRKMLVSSISHDLKTPITSIKGYVEGILDGVANNPEKIDRYLRTIYSKAEIVDSMIDDLLLYSKLDLNQLPFNFEKTNILEYFKDCVYESVHELNRYNIEISLENHLTSSKYVMLDRERMKRVIMNIIDNSRKYINKENGQITILLRESNQSIITELKDNGAGINKDDLNKIFDRFYRADSARTSIKGTGLGLAIARQIVEGHNGRIWAVSEENKGTSIIISLAKLDDKGMGNYYEKDFNS